MRKLFLGRCLFLGGGVEGLVCGPHVFDVCVGRVEESQALYLTIKTPAGGSTG